MIHFAPLVETVRWYQSGSYDERSPFTAVATLLHTGDREAELVALHGHIDRMMLDELRKALRERGIDILRAERHHHDLAYVV